MTFCHSMFYDFLAGGRGVNLNCLAKNYCRDNCAVCLNCPMRFYPGFSSLCKIITLLAQNEVQSQQGLHWSGGREISLSDCFDEFMIESAI